ncbi:MAG: hypothetical protein B6I25_05870 [Planctomycetales bacterium 4572_13]|nr:MAG: hypothetical protein B6I25_05870 [Planctomycetales bacterium 4572_13]
MALQTLEKPIADSRSQKSHLLGRSADSSAEVQSVTSTAHAKQAELVLFATQLSVMLDSGVVLSDAIEAIGQQMRPGIFQNVVTEIADRIKNGDNFSSALMAYPKIFNTMFVSMVRASEVSGRMSEMLEVLSGYLSAEAETRKQVKSAMIYPLVMLLMAVAATGSLIWLIRCFWPFR